MVSKVAVIALVAIVACPILIGYGMNLDTSTHTDYKEKGESINVTPLLQNGESYTLANADIHRLNTDFVQMNYDATIYPILPRYESITTVSSSLPLWQNTINNWTGGTQPLSTDIVKYSISCIYDRNIGSVNASVYHDSSIVYSISAIQYILYDRATDSITFCYYNTPTTIYTTSISGGEYTAINFVLSGFASCKIQYAYQTVPTGTYADISAGFHFDSPSSVPGFIKLPERTQSYLLTINLDSITDSDYNLVINDFKQATNLIKTTTNGIVSWVSDHGSIVQDLYYDPSRSDNTYQLYVEYSFEYDTDTTHYYSVHTELRYVGSWPTIIGNANSFVKYEYDFTQNEPIAQTDEGLKLIRIGRLSSTSQTASPIIRMDESKFLGFEYSTITDKVYDPVAFKSNPSTKLLEINKYGSYLEYGGNTFQVTDGNITLGTHQISIRNAVFDSIPTAGGYINRINGITISTTANPSTITFGGIWSASVTTDSMESVSYTSTDWTPGQFGWDGLDQNFLMVGLLTSVGAFIALGIYIRKTGRGLWPLLIVCGGAVMLFFIML